MSSSRNTRPAPNGSCKEQRERRRDYGAGGQSGIGAAHTAVERWVKGPARVAALQTDQASHDAASHSNECDETDRTSEGGETQAARHLDGYGRHTGKP